MSKYGSKPRENLGSQPLRIDLGGAPYKIGQSVRVHRLSDGEGDASYLRMVGFVEHLEYSCGCGQSYPDDPMIGVRFSDGRLEEFWKEELKLVRPILPQI